MIIFFFFSLLMWSVTLNDFWILDHPWTAEINPTWSRWSIPLLIFSLLLRLETLLLKCVCVCVCKGVLCTKRITVMSFYTSEPGYPVLLSLVPTAAKSIIFNCGAPLRTDRSLRMLWTMVIFWSKSSIVFCIFKCFPLALKPQFYAGGIIWKITCGK
jgi:hypothetical protein